MTESIFLGKTLGLYLIAVGLFYLFRRSFLQKAATQVFESESLIIITAIMSLIIGLLIVVSHNIWEWNWRVVITIIGYLALIKGIIRLFFSHTADKKIIMKLIKGDTPIYIGIVCLIIGLFLAYEGFFTS